ncbi:response regulator [Nocardioides antri]|uniref:histidine kinase n=1 Tax=Nocardioides antri TaxID=2607659 RepID=A0A5B1M9B1_9ACTN|nr:response regulator [Nocardioides antri]KAA1429423.1 response regulator [Nocardioides antri]
MKKSTEKLRQELEDTQRELADLQARVANAQQLANMGDYDWHIATDTNSWSDQLYRIYGYEPQEFNASYDRFLSMVHPDDRDAVTAVHRQVYETGGSWTITERIVRPDGDVRHLATNGVVVTDDDGTPVRMRGTCVDITDRVRAEAASEELAASLREWQVRRRHAFEINDNVVQGISAAVLALQLGDLEAVSSYLERTLRAARGMMGDLLLDRVADDAPEAGSLVRSTPAEAGTTPAPVAPRSDPSKVRVLLADDYHDLRDLMRFQLERAGYDVIAEATDGEQAVALVGEHTPDVIVLDLAMPKLDGLQALPTLLEISPDSAVIVVSGFANGLMADRVIAAGASRFVEKGVGLDVVGLVEDVVAERAG